MASWNELKEKLEELEGAELSITKRTTTLEKLQNLVASHYMTEDTLPQLQPMLAYDSGVYSNGSLDEYENSHYSIEPKFNGIRMLCFLRNKKVRFQTRGRSRHTQLFSERTGHYPQYHNRYDPKYEGTILDGEMVAFVNSPNRKKNLWIDNDLPLVMSMNGGRDEAGIATQMEKGWARYIVFDIISYCGEDVTHLSQKERRNLLLIVAKDLDLDVSPEWIPGKKYSVRERFDMITKTGGEGVILKNRDSAYEHRRSYSWLKVKRFEEIIGYVDSIYKMGSNSIEGMAGSIVIVNEQGEQVAIVGGLSHEIRKDLVLEDMVINPEYVGKKVLVRYHIKYARTGNPHHARLISWLDNDINYEETCKEEVS